MAMNIGHPSNHSAPKLMRNLKWKTKRPSRREGLAEQCGYVSRREN